MNEQTVRSIGIAAQYWNKQSIKENIGSMSLYNLLVWIIKLNKIHLFFHFYCPGQCETTASGIEQQHYISIIVSQRRTHNEHIEEGRSIRDENSNMHRRCHYVCSLMLVKSYHSQIIWKMCDNMLAIDFRCILINKYVCSARFYVTSLYTHT